MTKGGYNAHIDKASVLIMMGVGRLRPPIPLQIEDLLNLARLILGRLDSQALFWVFRHRSNLVLGSLFSIPYWKGNLPFFSYVILPPDVKPEPYIAYRNIGIEEVMFTSTNEDPKYVYGVVVEAPRPPYVLEVSLKNGGKKQYYPRPLMSMAKDVNSLVRLCYIMSDSYSSPPILHFRHGKKYILGVLAPFFDYYDANALPIFMYVEQDEPISNGYIRYLAVGGREESEFVDNVTDMKYYYARIVNVVDMPLWSPRSRRG